MSARRRGEAVLAVLIAGAAVVLVAGAGILYLGSTVPAVHTTPEAIPSAAAGTDAGRYRGAVDEARRLARALRAVLFAQVSALLWMRSARIVPSEAEISAALSRAAEALDAMAPAQDVAGVLK